MSGHHLMGKIAGIRVVKDKAIMKDIDVEVTYTIINRNHIFLISYSLIVVSCQSVWSEKIWLMLV